MREEWVKTTLGKVADWSAGGTPAATNASFYSDGTIPWAVIADVRNCPLAKTARQITEDGLEALGGAKKMAPAGSVLLTMYGSVGRSAIACIPMATNQAIAWAVPDESKISSEYLFCFLRSQESQFDALARGATQRNINKGIVTGFPISVPSLPEQQRIVDLIGSLDEAIEAADASYEAQLRALNNSLDAEVDGDTIALGDLATIKSGASWAAAEGSSRPIAGARPVVTIVNTRPNGSIDLTERTYVQGLSKSAASITKDSLVMIRTNGNRSRIGNVYRSTEDVIGDSVSAFQFVVEPITTEWRDFLFWSLRAPSRQERISDAASGSTGLGNIAAGWLKTLEVPWPDSTERGRLAALWESLGDTAAAVSEYTTSLRILRTNLLTALLSGTHEIPESYDDLLSEAV